MAQQLPSEIHFFLLADAIRQELGGKLTIIGAYSGGGIVFAKNQTFPAAMPLSILVIFKDGEGTFQGKLRVLDPLNKPAIPEFPLGQVSKVANQVMQLALNFPAFQFPSAGTFKVQIELDGHVYDESFSITLA